MAGRVCFPDTSIKVSQMRGAPCRMYRVAYLQRATGSEAPKSDADIGGPTVTAHLIFSATEFKDLADEHFWAIKCL